LISFLVSGKLSFVVLFGWFLERWRKLVFENLGSSWKTADFMDRSLFLAYERLMQALNYLIISFLLYEYVGISFAPIFAISGLGGTWKLMLDLCILLNE